jgi:SAM-dependent methyltransferase
MLARARSKSAGLPIKWVEGDARTFDLGEQFRLIFITGNAFQAFLTNADQTAFLQRVFAHLHPDGLFAFETRNPQFPSAHPHQDGFPRLETRAEVRPSFVNADGREFRESTTQVYDHVAQVLHCADEIHWHDGKQDQAKINRIALRYTFPQELAALLHHNGFVIDRQFGDWNSEPLSAASPSILSVCRKRAV